MSRDELRALEMEEDEDTLNRILRETLQPLLGFAKGRDVILLKDGFSRLADYRKVVGYHLGRLALQRLRGNDYQVEATTRTVAAVTRVPRKSCGEYHSRLKRAKLLDKNPKGWFIPPFAILRAATFLNRAKRQ